MATPITRAPQPTQPIPPIGDNTTRVNDVIIEATELDFDPTEKISIAEFDASFGNRKIALDFSIKYNGHPAQIQTIKMRQLAAHAKTTLESTYSLIVLQLEAFKKKNPTYISESSKMNKVKEFERQMEAFHNIESYNFITKNDEPYLDLKFISNRDTSTEKLEELMIKLDPEANGIEEAKKLVADNLLHELRTLEAMGPADRMMDRLQQSRYEILNSNLATLNQPQELDLKIINQIPTIILKTTNPFLDHYEPLNNNLISHYDGEIRTIKNFFEDINKEFAEAIEGDPAYAKMSGYLKDQRDLDPSSLTAEERIQRHNQMRMMGNDPSSQAASAD